MHPDIGRLLELQGVDAEIRRVSDECARLGPMRQACETEVVRLRERLGEAREEAARIEKEIRALEADVREWREGLGKFAAQQSRVKTQKEYDALTHEIRETERRISETEDRGLTLLAEQERATGKVAKMEHDLIEVERANHDEIERLNAREAQKRNEARVFESARTSAASVLSPPVLQRYERLAGLYPGNAVVPIVDKDNCGGCFMRIVPHRLQEIDRGEAISECDSCHRMVYRKAEKER